ncbi:ABC transporter permease [Nesterenkonia ebinurensis]|uniref:ABC transporter permease n=1 Tax=Nesterenkonia ebinurensis TaxID=2608252 RepID=UPI00123CF86F|nr:ABC transporter permease [Nesterenkonia ebinurensis]
MLGMVLRRFRDMVIVLVLVGTVMFFILQLIPGSPARAILGEYATESQVAALEAELGYDRPVHEQFFDWFGGMVTGDLGYSTSMGRGVTEAVFQHLGPTLVLALATTVLSVAIAIPLAMHTVHKPDAWSSRLLMGLSNLGLATPNFWLALVLVLIFAVNLNILPTSGYISPLSDPLWSVWYLVLPVVVLISNLLALLVMTLRESLSSELLSSYIRTARAKGLSESKVQYRHLLRNALLPVITVIGSNFGTLLGGIVIIEIIFVIPGMGWALNNGILARDLPLILGITLVSALIFVLINLLVDIAYGIIDPRVRVQ